MCRKIAFWLLPPPKTKLGDYNTRRLFIYLLVYELYTNDNIWEEAQQAYSKQNICSFCAFSCTYYTIFLPGPIDYAMQW